MKLFYFIALLLLVVSCSENDTQNFKPVIGTNGLKYHNGLIWVTDLIGQSITAFDPNSGQIKQQYDFSILNLSPDDLVFMDDETIVWTAPPQGTIGKIDAFGNIVILKEGLPSVNPIERRPGTNEVYIGFETENAGVGKLNIADGSVTLVAEALPSINGFSFAEDGLLYAPLFSVEEIFSNTGGIIKINISDGLYEFWPVTFPDNPNKDYLVGTTGTVADLNGFVYVLESVASPAIYKINLSTSEARLFGKIPFAAADNIAISPEGKIYVSSFIKNEVFEFDMNGNRRKIVIKNQYN